MTTIETKVQYLNSRWSPAALICRASERLRDGRVRINPGLGDKLAELLDEAAEHLEVGPDSGDYVCGTAREGLECSVLDHALRVARTILRETGEA